MHFCVIKSRTIKIFVAMLLVAVLLSLSVNGATSAQVYFGYSTRKVPIYNVETEEKQVAISFDAAWGADKTEKIIEILDEFDVTATFFLVGFWVDDYQDMVKTIDEAGLEIGTHSNTHPDMAKLDKTTIKSELETSISKIKAVTGKEVELFRAPFGSYNNDLLDVAESLNLKTIQWDVDSLDWKGLSASEISGRVLSRVKNGSIILMHNNSDHVLDGLRLILNRLKVQGYKVSCIGDLIYQENYTIDRNGVQHKI
ncbi:MAG: polysaccharide deacetylase family protein [Clostridia bacterium]|nr:polysaccharide deacetylase family protein [Clostridia bacterium]